MKEFISKNFTSLVIAILLVIIILQRCSGDGNYTPPEPRRDTLTSITYHIYQDTSKSIPNIINSIPPTELDIPVIMYPDTNYHRLKYQYDSLLNAHYTKNIQEDSLKVDTFGIIKVKDTVRNNRIIGREWISQLKIPEKTTTITVTLPEEPRNKLYIGGGVMGDEDSWLGGINGGLLLQDKKDRIFIAAAEYYPKWGVYYQLSSYWKIRLGKKK